MVPMLAFHYLRNSGVQGLCIREHESDSLIENRGCDFMETAIDLIESQQILFWLIWRRLELKLNEGN